MSPSLPEPSQLTLVLVSPQNIINIANAVRVCANFGIERMRLVAPGEFDAYRIEGIAHGTAELISRIEIVDTLEQALADCVCSIGLTARGRAAKRTVLRPPAAAARLAELGEDHPVAIVAGREDRGLTNDELDRCTALATIATDPRHQSLNLAQAVAIMAYETWVARGGDKAKLKSHRKVVAPATGAQFDHLFADWTRALWAIDFFKTRQPDSVMRSFQEIVHRAGLDGREAALLRAMAIEVQRYLERQGVAPASLPPEPSEPSAPPSESTRN